MPPRLRSALRLPWYVVLLVATYCLLQLGLAVEHPCAILGIATIDRAGVARAYRALSLCTHPDKHAGSADRRRELLFIRASEARDALVAAMREAAPSETGGEEEGESAGAPLRCSTGLDGSLARGASEMAGQLRTWWQQLLAALAPRLGTSPATLESSLLAHRFTIVAIWSGLGLWLRLLLGLGLGLGSPHYLNFSLNAIR